MFRTVFVCLFCFICVQSVYAQLPTDADQLWWEYPIGADSLHPPMVRVFQFKGNEPVPTPQVPSLVDLVKRETGPTNWNAESGTPFGLIGSDGKKLFVYHTPEMQRKVGETVGRILRPETRNVRFVTTTRYITISESARLAMNITDLREPLLSYLRPIRLSGRENVKVNEENKETFIYWVSRENIPKLDEKTAELLGVTQKDVHSNLLHTPNLTALNGQMGVMMDVSVSEFTTDYVHIMEPTGFPHGKPEPAHRHEPVKTSIFEGQTVGTFSLLSWDRQTVTTDIFAEFSKINDVVKERYVGTSVEEPETNLETERPSVSKLTVSEQGVVWPADGMLLIFLNGPKLVMERRVEAGTPILSKIPYINRLFMNTAIGRETQQIYCIMTVQMDAETQPNRSEDNVFRMHKSENGATRIQMGGAGTSTVQR